MHVHITLELLYTVYTYKSTPTLSNETQEASHK